MIRIALDKEIDQEIPETIPVNDSYYAQRAPNLIDALKGEEELSISVESKQIGAYCNNTSKRSICKRFTLFQGDERLGFLDFYDEADEIWYAGKTQEKLFIRMIYAQGKREDAWNVSFP
jgi:hypothetical protein